MRERAQALLFVLFLILILGIITAALATMWEADMRTRVKEDEGLKAFYLAQAGVERGKIEVLYGYWPTGTPTVYNITNQNDLDLAGDEYQFLYDIVITTPASGTTRTIVGIGRVLNLSGNEIARREIQVIVDGVRDLVDNGTGAPPPDGIDDDTTGNQAGWSWQEI